MSKLNKLLQSIPKNGIVLDSWLKQHGISNSLKQKYIQSGWLKPLGRGASYRTGDVPNWQQAVMAMRQQGMIIHIGGKTALEILGAGHFIVSQTTNLYLYAIPAQNLKQWFIQHDWKVAVHYLQTDFLSQSLGVEILQQNDGTMLAMSVPERAILELLYLVPKEQSFDEAYYIMENLSGLRPALLQPLLESCSSVKVKRLFFCLADKAGHSWVKEMNKARIEFGSGNRQIVSGGVLDPTYHITVPKNWKDTDEEPIF